MTPNPRTYLNPEPRIPEMVDDHPARYEFQPDGSLERLPDDFTPAHRFDSTFLTYPAGDPPPHIPAPDSGLGIQPAERRFLLDRYPDYEFLADGSPIMVRQPVRGPRVKLGPLKPIYTTSRMRYFSLRKAGGGRETKTERQIRSMLSGDSVSRDLFTIARFPHLRFDRDGRAYSLKRNRECTYSTTTGPNGFPTRTYKLRENGDGRQVAITDNTIRRILCGKVGESAPIIPDSFRQLDGDFIDFALDWETFELYRISLRRGHLLEPRLVHLPRIGQQYTLTNAEGRISKISRRKLLRMAGIDEDHPKFEVAMAAGSRVGD